MFAHIFPRTDYSEYFDQLSHLFPVRYLLQLISACLQDVLPLAIHVTGWNCQMCQWIPTLSD